MRLAFFVREIGAGVQIWRLQPAMICGFYAYEPGQQRTIYRMAGHTRARKIHLKWSCLPKDGRFTFASQGRVTHIAVGVVNTETWIIPCVVLKETQYHKSFGSSCLRVLNGSVPARQAIASLGYLPIF